MAKAQKPDSPPIIKDNFPQLRDNINLKGQEIIKYISKTLPCKPGVYQMENEDGKILYIGKAKNLARRVVNYTSLNNLTRRLQRIGDQKNTRGSTLAPLYLLLLLITHSFLCKNLFYYAVVRMLFSITEHDHVYYMILKDAVRHV